MGGLSYFRSKRGYQTRLAVGIPGDRIRNDPAFVRTRENGAEFGRAGKSAKLLRMALRTHLKKGSDISLVPRLTKDMLKVIQADTQNVRGMRHAMAGNVELLTGFEFNKNAQLETSFSLMYDATIDRVTGTLEVALPAYLPADHVVAPDGTTHFQFVVVGVEADFGTMKYQVATEATDLILLDRTEQPAQTLTVNVTEASDKALFLAFGIAFYQEVNGDWYLLKNGIFNALKLATVSKP